MNYTLRIFFLSFLFGISLYASAQTDTLNVRRWSLQECIDYAIKHNLDLKLNELNIETNEASRAASVGDLFPSLNASASHNYSFGRSVDPFTNQFIQQNVQSNNFQLNGSLTLFDGLQNINTVKQNTSAVKASQYDFERAKNDLTLNVINAYLQVLFNKELVTVAKAQLATTSEQAERTKRLVAAGSLPKSNELDITAQQASNEVALVTAENNLNIALLNLKQLLQLPGNEAMDVIVPEINVADRPVVENTPEQIYTIAEQSQPEIKAADYTIESSRAGLAAARGRYYPTLTLNGSIFSQYVNTANKRFIADGTTSLIPLTALNAMGNPVPVIGDNNIPLFQEINNGTVEDFRFWDQLDFNLRKFIGFSLQVPIFNGLQNRASVINAKVSLKRAEYNAQNTKNLLRQRIEQAYADALAAAKTYAASKSQTEAATESFRMTQQRLNAGAANTFDYTQAQNNLVRAQSDFVRSKYDYIFRMKILDFYQNKPIQF